MDIRSQVIERRMYSLELRHKICREHMEDGIRMAELVRKYELSSHSLIHDWLKSLGYIPDRYRRTKVTYLHVEKSLDLKTKNKKIDSLTADQQQIELLKKELEDARLQAEGYRRMIEIAEQELKISIRKKPNTK